MKTLDYPWDIFMGVSCPNQDAFGRRAQDLAVARDSFASPPRGTSLVLGAIRPSPHAGPLSGSGPAPPGRPARPALNVCLAWTPFCIPKLGGHTRRLRRTKRCRFFHRPWPPPGLDSLVFIPVTDLIPASAVPPLSTVLLLGTAYEAQRPQSRRQNNS